MIRSLGMIVVPIVVVCACASREPAPVDEGHRHHRPDAMPHRFEDAERWAAIFDAPERDAWQQPERVVQRLVTRDDLHIADVGAGTGYFSVRFARAVPRGRVVAIDIEETLLKHLAARAAHDGLSNVETRLAAPDDAGLQGLARAPDLVFVCNTYHHIAARPAYFAQVARGLAPGGRVAIVDFTLDSPRGPPRAHKIAPETVIAELAQAGLVLVDQMALPDQYLLVFERAATGPGKAPCRLRARACTTSA